MKTCLKTAAKELNACPCDRRYRPVWMKISVRRIKELEEASKNNDGLNFQIAINYGSRDEIDPCHAKNGKRLCR